jgi:glycosyltransferase involved in cell wall biosynthesis
MRIAVYHELPSGGAKRALFETVRRLARRHVVDVFTVTGADHDFCDLRPFVRAYCLADFGPRPQIRPPWARLNTWSGWRDLHRLNAVAMETAASIDRAAYDVVYANPSQWSQAPAVLGYLQTPTVYILHDCVAHDRPTPRRYPGEWSGWWSTAFDRLDPFRAIYARTLRELDRRYTHQASTLLTNSRFSAGNIASIYGLGAHVNYCGVDTDVFRPIRAIEKKSFVLSVGAVRDGKGFDFLVAALARIPSDSRPPLRIVANVEHPPERRYLSEAARRHGVDLSFEIGVSEATLVTRYNEASLVAYAPVQEPFGLVSLEAMACGVPVIGVREGGVAETVVDGVTGYLVERDDRRFADAVGHLTTNRGQCIALGSQARRHAVQHWTWESSVSRLEDHLSTTAGHEPVDIEPPRRSPVKGSLSGA